jgi:hypothetical protein
VATKGLNINPFHHQIAWRYLRRYEIMTGISNKSFFFLFFFFASAFFRHHGHLTAELRFHLFTEGSTGATIEKCSTNLFIQHLRSWATTRSDDGDSDAVQFNPCINIPLLFSRGSIESLH